MARVHRTTTTATLLVTVAVSALSGCVTVQRPPASGPPAPPVRSASPSVPRPDGQAEQRIVQAPAQEALEMVGPSRRPQPEQPHRPAAAGHPAPGHRTRPGPQHHTEETPHHRAARPEHHRTQTPRAPIPDVRDTVRRGTDVCGLGEQYGGWSPDSPQARICKQTYGR
ncbi:hypothetical protein C3489_29110 [Streptomyces sp. Ru71]|nr:hypothetical protein C3489_29110 [Streptomyces sp. Ru71]